MRTAASLIAVWSGATAVLFSSTAAAVQCDVQTLTFPPVAYSAADISGSVVTQNLTIRCAVDAAGPPVNGVVSVNVGLSSGLWGNASSRAMRGPNSALLLYNLYLPTLPNTVWGNAFNNSVTANITGLTSPSATSSTDVFVTMRMPPAQWGAPAGAYSDQLTVTLTF